MMDDVEMHEDSGHPNNEVLEEEDDDDDDEFYIPPPRPDLDLGQDTDLLLLRRAASPAMSYSSMNSDELSKGTEPYGDLVTRTHLERADSYSSCYSVDSEDCEKITPKVKMKESSVSSSSETADLDAEANDLRRDCLTVEFSYKAIFETLRQLSEEDFIKFRRTLWKNYPKLFHASPEAPDVVGVVDNLLDCYGLWDSLFVTRKVLERMGRRRAADYLQNLCSRNEVRHDLAQSLRTTYGVDGDHTAFSEAYTELRITPTLDIAPNVEHEVLKIEKSGSLDAGPALSTGDILSQEQVEQSHVNLAFLTGVAGSGKSSVVRKLILDWSDKRSHQHVSFLFPLPFRVLQQFESGEVSLLDILHTLYPETQRLKEADFNSEDCTMMFVCDGLDEYQDELDFTDTELLSDHTERCSLNVLVVNLLRGRLLYRGLFLFTTRPQVRSFIPWDAHRQVLEVKGFSEAARADFFRKRFEDQTQAASVLQYVDSNPTVRIMCHLPLFCSLVADEWRHQFKGRRPEPVLSLSYIYTKFLVVLTYQRRPLSAPLEFLMSLGRLAFHLLEQGKFRINKSDWSQFRVKDVEAVTVSGLCIEYLTKPFVLYEERVISFIHPTVQEHLAALYAFLSYKHQGRNIFEVEHSDSFSRFLGKSSKKPFYQCAVDRSLQCDDGRLDLFLRFLSGLHLKANVDLLAPLCVTTPTGTDHAVALLRKRIEKNQQPQRTHNLRCCLQELQQT
ncbi:NACHT, LRR and PYD domains-containing protein 3 [Synchiropus picturatus]